MQLEELLILLRLLSPQLRHMMLRALVIISREEEGQRATTTAPPPGDNPASSNPGIIIIDDWDRTPPPSPPDQESVRDGCPHRCWNCHDYFCSRGQQEHTHTHTTAAPVATRDAVVLVAAFAVAASSVCFSYIAVSLYAGLSRRSHPGDWRKKTILASQQQ